MPVNIETRPYTTFRVQNSRHVVIDGKFALIATRNVPDSHLERSDVKIDITRDRNTSLHRVDGVDRPHIDGASGIPTTTFIHMRREAGRQLVEIGSTHVIELLETNSEWTTFRVYSETIPDAIQLAPGEDPASYLGSVQARRYAGRQA